MRDQSDTTSSEILVARLNTPKVTYPFASTGGSDGRN